MSRIFITTSIRGNWRRSYARSWAVLLEMLVRFFLTAGPRRLRDRSSWRDWRGIGLGAMRSGGWGTFGALSLTGQEKHRKGFEPMLEEVTFVAQNDVEGLRAAVNDNTCAIVLEPIFGEGGIYECSAEFLQECRAAADRHRTALIFDEIQCGLGRTGTMFAFQSFGVTPDIVAIAKPIAAGLPLGAFIAKEEFANAIAPGQHGTTFGGGPLACRVALEFLAIVEEEKLLDNVNKVGAYLQQELKALAENSAAAREVRGRGFIQGIQLEIPARPIVDAALAEGVLFNSTQDTVVRFLPPFLLEEKHVDKGIRVLKKLLRKRRKQAA